MRVLWLLCLFATNVHGHLVTESSEEASSGNVTTLYPVLHHDNSTEELGIASTDGSHINNTNNTNSGVTVWKIDTAFVESKLNEDSNATDSKELVVTEKPDVLNSSSEFRPSPHLGDYIDDELEVTTGITPRDPHAFINHLKNTPSGFQSFSKYHKNPNELKAGHFPYKFESPMVTGGRVSGWKGSDRVPAGGLYKYPDPFTEKPIQLDDDRDLRLQFDGHFKETAIKKRPAVSPWAQLVRLITAFVPAGLLVSALAPSVITIRSAAPASYSSRYARRVDALPPPPRPPHAPLISERCRRRLLCELMTDKHYVQSPHEEWELSSRCARHRCADPDTLVKLVAWLLQHHAVDHAASSATPPGTPVT